MSEKLVLEFFMAQNPNGAFEFSEIHKGVNGSYKNTYNALRRLVNKGVINEVLPGLCGGRKKTYYLKQPEINAEKINKGTQRSPFGIFS